MEEKKYKVNGMFCAACQAHVQKAAEKVDGVSKADVSLLTNSMIVTFDGKADDKAIEKAIKAAGYEASPEADESYAARRKERAKQLNKTLKKLIISAVLLVLLMALSMTMMFDMDLFPASHLVYWVGVQLALTLAIIIIYFPYFVHGTKQLFKGHPTMETLISVGSGVSFIYGVYSYALMINAHIGGDMKTVMSLSMDLYFDGASMILTLVSIGKYIEALAKSKTTSSIENLMSLAPETALLVTLDGNKEVPALSLKVGDHCLVKSGMRVPVDGVVIKGNGNVEEAAITGEAVPVHKGENDKVIGSTLLTSGSFEMEVTEIGEDTTIAKIVRLVEEAAASKAKLARLADQVSAYFVPAVLLIALATSLGWGFGTGNWSFAVNMGVSVLVVSCPCALGLATPVAVMVGTGRGAEHGILIKSASAFEELARVKTIVLDKTGTITSGHMQVAGFNVLVDGLKDEVATALVSMESLSSHPLAEATVIYLEKEGYKRVDVQNFSELPGYGVQGDIDGHHFLIGNKAFLQKYLVQIRDEMDFAGASVIYVSLDGKYLANFAFVDEIKNGASADIEILKKEGYELYLATGDNESSAKAISEQVSLTKYFSSVKPDGKVTIIKDLQAQGKKVAMVGDGINDAPALQQADVGIAIGSGTDIAIDSADIVLVKSSLDDLVTATALSKKVVSNIKLNLFWAFIYNIIGIPLAAGVLFPALEWKLNPMIASALMALSSVSVVINALRLKWVKLR
jgi:heavy metal translocating P-type ATPase